MSMKSVFEVLNEIPPQCDLRISRGERSGGAYVELEAIDPKTGDPVEGSIPLFCIYEDGTFEETLGTLPTREAGPVEILRLTIARDVVY